MPTPLVIDLSHHNTVGSFVSVVNSGIVGVIHKATEGSGWSDDTYSIRQEDATKAGLLWGAYHFLRPGNLRQQADWFVDVAGDIDLYAADHEDAGVSVEDLKIFLEQVEIRTGKVPIIYSGHVLKEQVGDDPDPELGRCPLWLAQYTTGEPSWPTNIWENYWLWQYSDQGVVPGITNDCDVNHYDGSPDMLRAQWRGRGEFAPEIPEIAAAEVLVEISTDGPVKVRLIINGEEVG